MLNRDSSGKSTFAYFDAASMRAALNYRYHSDFEYFVHSPARLKVSRTCSSISTRWCLRWCPLCRILQVEQSREGWPIHPWQAEVEPVREVHVTSCSIIWKLSRSVVDYYSSYFLDHLSTVSHIYARYSFLIATFNPLLRFHGYLNKRIIKDNRQSKFRNTTWIRLDYGKTGENVVER